MLINTIKTVTIMLASLLRVNGCEANHSNPLPPNPITEDRQDFSLNQNTAINEIEEIATRGGIIGSHGSNFAYIDGQAAHGYSIIYESLSSRTKYLIITPIVEISQNSLTINCSHIKATTDNASISSGTRCKGPANASLDVIEDEISDDGLLEYTQFTPPTSAHHLYGQCKFLGRAKYRNYTIVRCQPDEQDGMTVGIRIHVLSSNNEIALSIDDHEAFPGISPHEPTTITFIKIDGNGLQEITRKDLP